MNGRKGVLTGRRLTVEGLIVARTMYRVNEAVVKIARENDTEIAVPFAILYFYSKVIEVNAPLLKRTGGRLIEYSK